MEYGYKGMTSWIGLGDWDGMGLGGFILRYDATRRQYDMMIWHDTGMHWKDNEGFILG